MSSPTRAAAPIAIGAFASFGARVPRAQRIGDPVHGLFPVKTPSQELRPWLHDLDDRGRTRFSVHHNRKEWARDDDGDGVREVHSNTIEGFWLGLRNYLRPFRGVSTWCLDLYLAFYEAIHNHRRDFLGFLRRLLGPFTGKSP